MADQQRNNKEEQCRDNSVDSIDIDYFLGSDNSFEEAYQLQREKQQQELEKTLQDLDSDTLV